MYKVEKNMFTMYSMKSQPNIINYEYIYITRLPNQQI